MNRGPEWVYGASVTSGIHTLEVRTREWSNHNGELPYLRMPPTRIRHEGWQIQINPHKAQTAENGKYQPLFGDGKTVMQVIDRASQEMEWSADWRFSRIDYAFDIGAPFAQTAGLTRLLVLMLASHLRLGNDYMTIDPMTGEEKSTSARTASRNAPGRYEIEHYNRALIDQSRYAARSINRLELRMMGKSIGDNRNAYGSVERWFSIMDRALTRENYAALEGKLANMLFSTWKDTCSRTGLKRIQNFVRARGE